LLDLGFRRLAETVDQGEHEPHRVHVFRLDLACGNLARCDLLKLEKNLDHGEGIDQAGRNQRRIFGDLSALTFEHFFSDVAAELLHQLVHIGSLLNPHWSVQPFLLSWLLLRMRSEELPACGVVLWLVSMRDTGLPNKLYFDVALGAA